jgi:hypothetical protein
MSTHALLGILGLCVEIAAGVLVAMFPQSLIPWFVLAGTTIFMGWATVIWFLDHYRLQSPFISVEKWRASQARGALLAQNTWRDRDHLEISAIACLSLGLPVGAPLSIDPQLSRHRALRDAVNNRRLQPSEPLVGDANVHTRVTWQALTDFVLRDDTPGGLGADLRGVLRDWGHPISEVSDGAR